MKQQQLRNRLAELRQTPGVRGCAAVEPESGIVVAREGEGTEAQWEAAVDYWRMHDRLRHHFAQLGSLRMAVMYHTEGVLAVLRCQTEPPLLIVCVGAHRGTDWSAVQRQVRQLSSAIESSS